MAGGRPAVFFAEGVEQAEGAGPGLCAGRVAALGDGGGGGWAGGGLRAAKPARQRSAMEGRVGVRGADVLDKGRGGGWRRVASAQSGQEKSVPPGLERD